MSARDLAAALDAEAEQLEAEVTRLRELARQARELDQGDEPENGQPARLLDASEVAALLRVPKARVYGLAAGHEIPVVRIGARQLRFPEAAVARWLLEQTH